MAFPSVNIQEVSTSRLSTSKSALSRGSEIRCRSVSEIAMQSSVTLNLPASVSEIGIQSSVTNNLPALKFAGGRGVLKDSGGGAVGGNVALSLNYVDDDNGDYCCFYRVRRGITSCVRKIC